MQATPLLVQPQRDPRGPGTNDRHSPGNRKQGRPCQATTPRFPVLQVPPEFCGPAAPLQYAVRAAAQAPRAERFVTGKAFRWPGKDHENGVDYRGREIGFVRSLQLIRAALALFLERREAEFAELPD